MRQPSRQWIAAGFPADAFDALAGGLEASRVWSLLLAVAEARAGDRAVQDLVEQWTHDRFVQPAYVDQRSLIEVDRHLLSACAAFEAIELSPVAPLGACSAMGRTSQNKILTTLRGTEVVADPTNVMALECARRLKRDMTATIRLATSHRCVRAQEIPKIRGFAAHFRIFCLASAGVERRDHAFTVESLAEQIAVLSRALDLLEQHGFAFPGRRTTGLATAARSALGDRIAERLHPPAARSVLDHAYYNGLRYQIAARTTDGIEIPLVDGGVFDWVARLASNRRAVYAASGIGSQLIPFLFRPDRVAAARGSHAT